MIFVRKNIFNHEIDEIQATKMKQIPILPKLMHSLNSETLTKSEKSLTSENPAKQGFNSDLKQDMQIRYDVNADSNDKTPSEFSDIENCSNEDKCLFEVLLKTGKDSDAFFEQQDQDESLQWLGMISNQCNNPKEKSNTKAALKRWGKDKDKLAVKTLNALCKASGLNTDQFIQVDTFEVYNEDTQEFKSEVHEKIIKWIALKYNWTRKPVFLFQRIKKIHTQDKKLSVREIRMLKSILIKNRGKFINEKEIMFHFPGKSIAELNQAMQKVLQSKWFPKSIQ